MRKVTRTTAGKKFVRQGKNTCTRRFSAWSGYLTRRYTIDVWQMNISRDILSKSQYEPTFVLQKFKSAKFSCYALRLNTYVIFSFIAILL